MLTTPAMVMLAMFFLWSGPQHENPWPTRAKQAVAAAEARPTLEKYQKALDAAYRADDWQAGLSLSEQALKHPSWVKPLRSLLVRALWRAGRIGQAERLAGELVPEKTDRIGAAIAMRIALANGQRERAARFLNHLRQLGPNTADEAATMLFVEMTLGQTEGLAELARKAAEWADAANGYPDTYLAESLEGFPKLLEAIGDQPLNVVSAYGRAPMPPVVGIGLPSVEAYINGEGPYRFIVDTGGSIALSLSTRVADDLGLKPVATSSVRGVGGSQEAGIMVIDRLSIGQIEVRHVLSHRFDMPAVLNGAIDGVLGTGVFARSRFTLNLADSELVVAASSDKPAAGHALDLRIVADAKLTALIKIEGQPAVALIDSGADAVALSPHFVTRQFPDKDFPTMPMPAAAGVGEGDSGGVSVVPGVHAEIAGRTFEGFGGVALSTLDDTLSPIIGLQYDILLGMPLLRETQSMTIDAGTRQGWIEWAETSK